MERLVLHYRLVDMGVKEVKKYYVSSEPNDYAKSYAESYKIRIEDLSPMVFLVEENSNEFKPKMKEGELLEKSKPLKAYLMDNFSETERDKIRNPKYFYNITFEKPGGLVMPLIVEYKYLDGTKEKITYPAQIWRHNDNEITKAIASEKEIISIKVDPDYETADVDESNNSWPKEIVQSKFEKFKSKSKN